MPDDNISQQGSFTQSTPRTIVEAIKVVLQEHSSPLRVDEIYRRIIERGLYSFKAVDPKSVVRAQLRRHCFGLDFPAASPMKYFRLVDHDKYALESAQGVRKKVSSPSHNDSRNSQKKYWTTLTKLTYQRCVKT